jgi:hypothetical protein
VKQFVKILICEPLVHFLLIGAGLFILFGWFGSPAPSTGRQSGPLSKKIVVTQGDMDQLVAMFTKTWQRAPSEEELKGLVDNFVRDEIYYREALMLGLDRGDAVIRKRMRQRMEFIFEDVMAQVKPTDADLGAYMRKHPEKYYVDPQVAFRQVYVSVDKRGETAESDALQILAQLKKGAEPDAVGDPFLLKEDNRLSPLWDIRKQFGEEFSRSLLELKPGSWEGPIRSEYGLHLVFINERLGGQVPELSDVREAVKRDWSVERQKKLKDVAYAKVRERYIVEFEKPQSSALSAVAEAGTRAVTR